jgi:hypothetical protein
MATCVDVSVNDVLKATTTPIDQCTSYILMDSTTYRGWAPFDPAALDPVVAIEAFGAGWIVFAIPIVVSWCVKMLLKSILL